MKGQTGTTGDRQTPLFGHRNGQWSPWSPVVPINGDRGPRVSPPMGGPRGASPKRLTQRFAANTCPDCHHITIGGITDHGFTLHLEPLQLTDLDEARAIGDQVPTYNLYPDRLVRLRWLTHIRHPATVARHARHTCDTTYGTLTPPAPAKSAPLPDSPPF